MTLPEQEYSSPLASRLRIATSHGALEAETVLPPWIAEAGAALGRAMAMARMNVRNTSVIRALNMVLQSDFV
jgi:hypothetical protein